MHLFCVSLQYIYYAEQCNNASIDYEYKRTFNQLYVEKNQTLPLIFNRYMIRKCFVYHERASFDHSYDVNSYCKCEK